jgi:hypothetical protein
MNVIVNDSTRWIPLIILCLIMLAISLSCFAGPANWAGGEHPTHRSGVREMIMHARRAAIPS